MSSSEIQGRLWGAHATDWAELFEPMSKPIWIAMLDSVDLQKGMRFLDLGCGGGGASVLAHERGAQIAGLDAASELIAIARRRVVDGDFRIGDLERLPYEDNSFDVVFASMSIMFAADPLAALGEMKRVTASEGQITLGVWGNPEACEYRHVLAAVAATLPSPTSGNGPFSLSGTGELEELLDKANLKLIDSGEVDGPFRFAGYENMWRAVSSAGPFQSAIKRIGEDALRVAVAKVCKPFEMSNGEILFNNRFRFATAAA